MDNESGVTRDRHYGYAEWTGHRFTVIDTGGYVVGSDDVFEEAIRKQVHSALGEATAILLKVDCISGLTDLDRDLADVVRVIDVPSDTGGEVLRILLNADINQCHQGGCPGESVTPDSWRGNEFEDAEVLFVIEPQKCDGDGEDC
jgi:tRNA U34 5-carboxymethylaminomethyl modifying GTPase MnmE/TrmE